MPRFLHERLVAPGESYTVPEWGDLGSAQQSQLACRYWTGRGISLRVFWYSANGIMAATNAPFSTPAGNGLATAFALYLQRRASVSDLYFQAEGGVPHLRFSEARPGLKPTVIFNRRRSSSNGGNVSLLARVRVLVAKLARAHAHTCDKTLLIPR
ncbi:hypothetical protein [Bosea sp. ANAM02]|uniref:hypothetical protein n=1 Tax=Bosea sp. ANAM02 TaxID=2020412 RepID=UPI001564929F|nr:hypothetical protein [Bosea sp. ANAM02]